MKFIGIDVGKEALHVCTTSQAEHPKMWKVVVVRTTEPQWELDLFELLRDATAVAIESTGYHYSAPVFRVAERGTDQCYEVHNPVTQRIRELYVMTEKNDFSDARALAYIAKEMSQGRTVKGVHARNYDAIELRMLVNERATLTRIQTRTTNRAEQIAYSISPAYAHNKTAFVRCLEMGLVSPAEIKAADLSGLSGNKRKAIEKLADQLPEGEVDERAIIALRRASDMLILVNEQIEVVEDGIKALVENDPEMREIAALWQTIPGVGIWCAVACLIPCNGDPLSLGVDGFKRALGVAPNSAQSGNTKRSRKTPGYTPAKQALHLAALSHLKRGLGSIVEYRKRENATFFSVKRKLVQAMYGIARTRTAWDDGSDVP